MKEGSKGPEPSIDPTVNQKFIYKYSMPLEGAIEWSTIDSDEGRKWKTILDQFFTHTSTDSDLPHLS